jgi:O-antigen/teichoic acid export membrane protein
VLFLSLYTSRLLLGILGFTDFGIYNVVAGLIIMFSFLNNTMASSCQRFFAYNIGKKDTDSLSLIYSQTIIIHLIMAIFIVILVEISGLWLLNNKLTIPPDRYNAALSVFHISVLGLFISTMKVPFHALIIAYEKMKFFGIVSVLEVSLKLLMIILIGYIVGDKLIMYSCGITIISFFLYITYFIFIKKNIGDLFFKWILDKNKFKELASFSGWNLIGSLSVVFKDQGNNILINIFFGPIVNAARGISYQISGALFGFVSNIFLAINPQIIKAYAKNDITYMHSLIFIGSRISYFLLLLMVIPIYFNTEGVLIFWLKNIPDNTIFFTKIILIILLINSLANPLMVGAQANGKIKKYQLVVGLTSLLIVPITYLFYKLGYGPEYAYYVTLVISIIAYFIRLLFLKFMVSLNITEYIQKVISPILKVSILTLAFSYVYNYYLNNTINNLIISIIINISSTIIIIYFFGLTIKDKNFIKNKIKKRV